MFDLRLMAVDACSVEELAIDELKTHQMERPVLRSQTPAGVVQEIYGLPLGHFVLRSMMFQAAQKAGTSPVRISFTDTLKILRCRLPECPGVPRAGTCGGRNCWRKSPRNRFRHGVTAATPGVIKKPQRKWPKKRYCHRHTPQPMEPFRDSIKILR